MGWIPASFAPRLGRDSRNGGFSRLRAAGWWRWGACHIATNMRVGVVATALASIVAVLTTVPAEAATITVTGPGDTIAVDGVCTLREAIAAANTNAPSGDCPAGQPLPTIDTIAFDIPGAGVRTISVTAALPAIYEGVTIDGFTQPGSRPNSSAVGSNAVISIELNGAGAGATAGLILGDSGAFCCDVHGLVTLRGLVVNRFRGAGIQAGLFSSVFMVVEGCYIGTSPDGLTALPNNGGVSASLSGGQVTIGGETPAARNVISGNSSSGVRLANSEHSSVLGNYIGVDATGLSGLANNGNGVTIDDGSDNVVGGLTAGARNVISGNSGDGIDLVSLNGPLERNKVRGNYIGTDVTGARALGNGRDGVLVHTNGNAGSDVTRIGGTEGGSRNVISGNHRHGIVLLYGQSLATGPGAIVQGNYVGTDLTGAAAVGNGQAGIVVFQAVGTTIGGTTGSARNVISGNNGAGVSMGLSAVTSITIVGNFIGTDLTGARPLGNAGDGVAVGASQVVGSTTPGTGNTIAYNAGEGVTLNGPNNRVLGNKIFSNGKNGVRVHNLANRVLGNSIYGNGQLGIDVDPPGVTPNDPGDADSVQNAPVLTSAMSGGSSTVVQGLLNSRPSRTYRIEFFAVRPCDPSGFGEGQDFLGTVDVTTSASGAATISATLPVSLLSDRFVTATATDLTASTVATSEFSACRAITTSGAALLGNPSFEEADSRGVPGVWFPRPGAVRDTAVHHTGAASLRLDGPATGEVTTYTFQSPAVLAGQTYELTAWVKTQSVTGAGIRVRYAQEAPSGRVWESTTLRGTTDWTQVSVTFTLPSTFSRGRLDVYWSLRPGDRAWVDDVSLRCVSCP